MDRNDLHDLKNALIEEIKEEKILLTVFALLFLAFYYYVSHMGCSYIDPQTKTTIYGNCHELMEHKEIRENKLAYYIRNQINTTVTTQTIPIITCPPQTTIPCPTQTTQTCPPCTCEVCHKCPEPQCNCIETEKMKEFVLGLKTCHQTESPAWQDGCYTMWKIWRENIGLEVSKYKESPSNVDIQLIYTQGHTSTQDNEYCFRNYGGYFTLNRTPDSTGRKRWSWTDSQCTGSVLEIRHL